MSMKIDSFKAAFENGVRPTLYTMEILGLPEELKFFCKTTQMPGKTIGIIEVPYMGMKVKIAGDVTFEDLNITVMLDNDFAIRNELEIWMETIKANESAVGLDAALYKRAGSVIQLDNEGKEIAQYSFIGLWPNSITPIEMGFENVDTISEYSVIFSYDFWTRIS